MKRQECPPEIHDSKCYGCGWKLFRCSRCGGCYACEHEALYEGGKWVWLCRDNRKRPVICEECGCSEKERQKKQVEGLLARFRPTAPQNLFQNFKF
jgi:hypothetical protein